MEKKIFAVLVLFLAVGTAFAQAPTDSTKAQKSPELLPRLKFKKKADRSAFKFEMPQENGRNLIARALPDFTTPPPAKQEEEVTPFYSNMPMAKLQGRKQPMPAAKADSTRHYHLLKKRFKVLPVPTEPEESKETEYQGTESRK
ncbi:hypothetical protein [Rufibacter sp. XAAS-G3-1]|uniref:hypothetical protein n=1 Tax=Rufibacter sp. XAAS-G3-1 TaxID=2729134 RepID=UPI0015E6F287|nr:hypothetical protein [Rufibacter sp. XAAS-G3-1]